MRYVATLAGVEHEFEIEELSGHALRLRLGDELFEADVRRAGPSSYSILIGERSFDLEVARRDDELMVVARDAAVPVLLQDALRRTRSTGGRASAGGKTEIKAMMPGRVVTLLVKVGDEVAAQQGIVVVEAMKMENELKSPRAGKVTKINVTPGQTVEKGDLLVTIE
ncbi:MAG TPA: biotin/lipoyl-containing protein [Candidatus Binataceae bacterium]|nr:biotin/lipoyl-containing protein [Candidatus Binataceae bacterium]